MRISDWSSDVCSSDLIATCMRREIREEAAIECESMHLRGTLNWPGFGKHGEDWLGFIFIIDAWHGTPLQGNHEGTLEWVERERSEERRGGKECVRTCRSRWSPYHKKKKKLHNT